jgi:hypothetical protein
VLAALSWSSRALSHSTCRASERTSPWYVPAFVKAQTGGYLGAFTLGTGYTMPGRTIELAAYYGWVPAALGGVSIHSFAARFGVRAPGVCVARNWDWVFATGGVGAVFTFGDGFFVFVPERYYDTSYYRPTGVRSLFTVGTELNVRQRGSPIVASHGLFVEVTTLDEYLRLWLKSPEEEPFAATLSTSFGYRIGFH